MNSTPAGKLQRYLSQIRPPAGAPVEEGLESTRPEATVLGGPEAASAEATSIAERGSLSDRDAALVKSAIEKLDRNEELNREEGFVTEAIIIPDKRPAIDIVNGDFVVDHPLWVKFSTDAALHGSIKKAILSVGRIELPHHPSLPYGGTGFVVGENLLMTNRHVAEIFTSGLGDRKLTFKSGLSAGIDFVRERDSVASTVLAVRKVVMIHPYWDMALLLVDGLGSDHVPLELSVRAPDELVNTEIAVIGYPAFDPRNDPGVQNQVFHGLYNVKRLQPGLIMPRGSIDSFGKTVSALCHDSSTLGGNSGSGVYDPKDGKIVALHFAGVYLDRNYCVPTGELARDGRVVDAGVNFAPAARGGTPPWQKWWDRADPDNEKPSPKPDDGAVPSVAGVLQHGQSASWTIPIEISIRVGGVPVVVAGPVSQVTPDTEAAVSPTHDADYSTRKGYDAMFLGVALPPPDPAQPDAVVSIAGKPLIPYHHFSLALHRKRRIALFTASNLDASSAAKRPEPGKDYDRKTLGGLGEKDMEKWFPDPRVDPAFQLPDRFYTKDKGAFDRGHIVRREDVAWGRSFQEVQFANGDTFHVTNCSPQVAVYNQSAQGVNNWGDLENYVMKQAGASRLSIFAGPVLADDDPVFLGVDDAGPVRAQIPREFWKVIVASENGKLQSFGFVLRQDLSNVPLEFVVDPVWQRYMISISEIASRNPLVKFDKSVAEADQFAKAGGKAVRDSSGVAAAVKEKRAGRTK
ncbi:DNA/RNA non-specific endonuclease [Mesorhizobium sp. M0016]|uniref:DNA/RNA non-specific endonuclease n=1 Tax=Mesorhizobium sp. M0016 TaxID=2956843 RepID=UPI00333875EF